MKGFALLLLLLGIVGVNSYVPLRLQSHQPLKNKVLGTTGPAVSLHKLNARSYETGEGDLNKKATNKKKMETKSKSSKSRRREGSNVLRWKLYNIEVPLDKDPGKDDLEIHESLMKAIAKQLGTNKVAKLEGCGVEIVKKSFDGRWKKLGQPKFTYTVDINLATCKSPPHLNVRPKAGQIDALPLVGTDVPVAQLLNEYRKILSPLTSASSSSTPTPRVVIVGAGPAGLFGALALVAAGIKPVIIERGQPVETRGRSIGALFNRNILDPESNLCYGEGGAGTWSDGKLTTRIGKNSANVRWVLEELVRHGAPERILVDGKPHLGTDRLVRILKGLRAYLEDQGAVFKFESRVDGLVIEPTEAEAAAAAVVVVVGGGGDGSDSGKQKDVDEEGTIQQQQQQQHWESDESADICTTTTTAVKARRVVGVRLHEEVDSIPADYTLLSVGHSARKLYERLHQYGIKLTTKPIAAGFRVEHPQELINRIQYGDFGMLCARGKGPVPVADYRVTSDVFIPSSALEAAEASSSAAASSAAAAASGTSSSDSVANTPTTTRSKSKRSSGVRTCYSFCMCPGGQIVPTSVNPDELCINGMSFSKRQSQWANSALVVNVNPEDMHLPLPPAPSLQLAQQEAQEEAVVEEGAVEDGAGASRAASPETKDSEGEEGREEGEEGEKEGEMMVDHPLRGIYWQEAVERRAAVMGGGGLVAPVQRVTDFLAATATTPQEVAEAATLLSHPSATTTATAAGSSSSSNITSSYRLGVKEAPCHEIYPPFVTQALRRALLDFDRKMPGFVSPEAILHGVETRTSSPVQITREADSCESVSVAALYPAGEGAGYAGGIVSAAVDGLRCARGILRQMQSDLLLVPVVNNVGGGGEVDDGSPVDTKPITTATTATLPVAAGTAESNSNSALPGIPQSKSLKGFLIKKKLRRSKTVE